MGDETQQKLSLRGLQNAAGFLQAKMAKRIDTRYTPRLVFVLDMGVKHSIEISQILQSVLPVEPSDEPPSRRAADRGRGFKLRIACLALADSPGPARPPALVIRDVSPGK